MASSTPRTPESPGSAGKNSGGTPLPLSGTADCVDRHGDALYRFAFLRVRDEHVAQDLVQETFLAMLKGRQTFDGRSAERTWLIGILKHKIADHFRRASREATAQGGDAEGETGEIDDSFFTPGGHWKRPPGRWSPDASTLLESREFWEVFSRCRDKLPAKMGQAFCLSVLDENDGAQVCKALGLTPTNLWVTLHRARLRLRECLEANWFKRSG